MTDTEAKTTRPELNEIASTNDGRDITRGFVEAMHYLSPADKVLQQAGGLEAYEELLKDDQVSATFAQRRNAVLARPWTVTPGGTKRQDKLAAKLVEETLKALPWDTITDHMLYARLYGYAVAEVMWVVNSQVKISDIRVRDRRRFVFAPDNSLKMLTHRNPNGEVLPDRKFWVSSVGASHNDEPYGLGLGHALYWPVFFKRNGARFWAKFMEKFASPTAMGTFPAGASDSERQKLLGAVRAVAMDSGIIIPEGTQIQLLEATRGGNASYGEWLHYWDSAIAKVILGQTMTTEDGSSYSQATVHYAVRQDLVKADADLVSQTANSSWVRWLVDYNFAGAAYPQIWRDMEEAEDLAQRSTRDKTLFDMGYKLTPEAVTRVYGDDYEPIEPPQPETKPDPIPAKQEQTAPALAEGDEIDLTPSPVEPLANALDQQSAPAWRKILDHIQQLVNSAPDLPTLRDALLNAYAELPGDELGDVMALAMLTAELAGRYDVEQESADD